MHSPCYRLYAYHAFPPPPPPSTHARTHNVTRSTTTTMYALPPPTNRARKRRYVGRYTSSLSLSIRISSLPLDRCYTATHIFSLSRALRVSPLPPNRFSPYVPFPPPSDGFCSLPSSPSSTCTIPSPSQISFYVRPPSASYASVRARRNVPFFFFLPSLPHTPPGETRQIGFLCAKRSVGSGFVADSDIGERGGRGGQIMTRCVINNPPSIQSTHYNRGNEEAPPPFQGRGGEAK